MEQHLQDVAQNYTMEKFISLQTILSNIFCKNQIQDSVVRLIF